MVTSTAVWNSAVTSSRDSSFSAEVGRQSDVLAAGCPSGGKGSGAWVEDVGRERFVPG